MLKIWGRPNSINVQKVMWVIGELGLDHERVDVGGAFGGLDTDEYRALNPNRKIPVLDDDGTIVWESHSCVRYLAAKHLNGSLWPDDLSERSVADRWMDWKITTVLPQLHICFWGLIRTAEADRNMAAIDKAAHDLGEIWGLFDDHLKDRTFVTGDRLTMGDIPLGAAFYRYASLPIERPSLPAIDAWYQRLQARPAYRDHVMIPVT
ncbi:MAG: glutathione S-transferase family protein [Geminicoccaceae bacterium]